ncbi:MAG: cysteine--tRNA ligase, partial [Desulfobacteraceae bacterium]|nr:cysteine--tRNA ligase [Desulfobacteraceae bacterium]
MAIRIFDTLTRAKKPFIPIVPGKVSIYVCGPTVYDEPHPGHARSAVIYDVIRRYLTAAGYSVTYVRNVTDIDDKIIEKARDQNRNFQNISAHFLQRYHRAMARLNVLSPDAEPRATDFILPMHALISRLIQGGHAYQAGGNVYFSVKSFGGYGKLSGRAISTLSEENIVPPEPNKKHPADFALWKASPSQEPFWPSPWGPGRPGWHIECSAMSTGLLSEVFDIHGGGSDLIFPHHENEIAQSESISGKNPANHWVHNGLVHVNGAKMSKSLANSPTLNELLDTYAPEIVRLFLLSKRYGRPMEFSRHSMLMAARSFARLQRFFSRFSAPAGAA